MPRSCILFYSSFRGFIIVNIIVQKFIRDVQFLRMGLVKTEQLLIPSQMVRLGASPACMVGSSTGVISLHDR